MNTHTHPIDQAISFLAAMCDGAKENDAVGFNKPDSHAGHFYAGVLTHRHLTDGERFELLPMLKKYQGQLDSVNIELPEAIGDGPEKRKISAHLSNNRAILTFQYDRDLVNAVKEIDHHNRSYDRDSKCWSVMTAGFMQMVDILKDHLIMSPSLEEFVNECLSGAMEIQPVKAEDGFMGRSIKLDGKWLRVKWQYKDPLFKEIKAALDEIRAYAMPNAIKWLAGIKEWSVSLTEAENLIAAFTPFAFEIDHEEIKSALDEISDKEKADAHAERIAALEKAKAEAEQRIEQEDKLIQAAAQLELACPTIPEGWTLYPFQERAIQYIVDNRRGIIAYEQGLGKTAINALASRLYQRTLGHHVMIICPSSVIHVWQQALDDHELEADIYSWESAPTTEFLYTGTFKKKRVKDEWLTVNELSHWQVETAIDKGFQWRIRDKENGIIHQEGDNRPYFVIADESHRTADETTGQSKRMLALCQWAEGAVMASGTPLANGKPINLLVQLRCIKSPIVATRDDITYYRARYCRDEKNTWKSDNTDGAQNLDELYNRLMETNAILYYTKQMAIDEGELTLPPKNRYFVGVEAPAAAIQQYKARFTELQYSYHLRKELKRRNGKDTSDKGAILVAYNNLRRASEICKIDTGIDMALKVLQENKPVAIFTVFLDGVETLKTAIEKAGYQVDIITGDVDGDERKRIEELYKTGTGNARCFIGTKASFEGLTLTDINDVISLTRHWTSAAALQSEDRAWRIGQTEPVNVTWLQFGIDSRVDELVINKSEITNMVMTGQAKKIDGERFGSIQKTVTEDIFGDGYSDDDDGNQQALIQIHLDGDGNYLETGVLVHTLFSSFRNGIEQDLRGAIETANVYGLPLYFPNETIEIIKNNGFEIVMTDGKITDVVA